jgi:transcription elongation factor GreA
MTQPLDTLTLIVYSIRAMDELYLGKAEYEQLKQRLDELEKQRRVVAQEIAEARVQRDLRENAAYHAAKEKQAFLEGEIAEITRRLRQARILVDESQPDREVRPGSRVRIADLLTGEELRVVLVSDLSLAAENELMPVSARSPLGQALIGRRPGQTLSIQAPRGVQQYQILEIL